MDLQDYKFLDTLKNARLENIVDNVKTILEKRQIEDLDKNFGDIEKDDIFILKSEYDSIEEWREFNPSLFYYAGAWTNGFGYSGYKFKSVLTDEDFNINDNLEDVKRIGKMKDGVIIWNEESTDIKNYFIKLLGVE